MPINFPDAAADSINCGDIAALDGLTTLSLSAWVRLNVLQDYQHIINKGIAAGDMWGMQCSGATEGTNNDVTCNAKNAGSNITQDGYTTGNILAADGLFHHWCMVYNGAGAANADRLKFYFDGIQRTLTYRGTIPATLDSNAGSVYFGRAEWDPGFELNGALDDLRTYTRVLTLDEIETIFTCRGHDGITVGLLNRYDMDELAPPTALGFPTVLSTTPTSFTGVPTTHNVAMPATVNPADLLIMHITVRFGASFTTPAGWTSLGTTTLAGCTWAAFAKGADGTEGGTTVNVISSVAGNGAAQVLRIANTRALSGLTNGSIVLGGATTGATANPDPPSIGLSNGPENTLFVALAGGADDDEAFTGFPAGFAGGVSTISGGGVDNGGEVGSAYLASSTQPTNPGTFTLSGAESWVAQTLCIRPLGLPIDVTSGNHGAPIGAPTYVEGTLSKRRRFT